MKLHLLLEMAAAASLDRIAIGSRDTGLSFQALLQASQNAADWMATGSRTRQIAYCGLNNPALPIALFGASQAGCVFTALNYRLPDNELRRLLSRLAPANAVCDPEMLDRLTGVDGVTYVSMPDFVRLAERDTSAVPADETGDAAVVLFTSGTTSEPKAAILRHHHLTSYVISTLEFQSADEDEAALVSVPPYHIAGISAVLTSTYVGRRMVILPAFTPEAWVETVVREDITHAMIVPTMLGRIVDVITERKIALPSLRSLSYGGGRMPAAVIKRAMELLPHVGFVNAYGLTETSSTISILDPNSHRSAYAANDPAERGRLTSVGKPLPTVEIEIRDAMGQLVPAGTVGEVWVRGDQVAGEYAERKVIRDDGWFPTNDAGWMDDEGYLYLEGRLDDVIVRGGENISSLEIENILMGYPGVKDAAVFGIPDEEWGEKVMAAVVAEPSASEEDIKAHVKGHLRSSRVPHAIIFRSELPYNDMGKLLRRVLKAEANKPTESLE